MHQTSISRPLILLLLWHLTASLPADELAVSEPAAPPLTVQGCFGCHGPAGNSGAPAIPSLAGLPRGYLLEILKDFRHGGRFGTIMGRLLQDFTDAQLSGMADYFSRQTAQIPRQQVDWDLASRGRQLHRLYCRECHGDPGHEPEADTPRLSGVWMDYLRWTLKDYLLGANQSDDEMSQALIWVIRRHGEAGLEALVHYYGSARSD